MALVLPPAEVLLTRCKAQYCSSAGVERRVVWTCEADPLYKKLLSLELSWGMVAEVALKGEGNDASCRAAF